MNTYIGLVHYPVYDRKGRVVASSILPYDIVDISRLSKTFGVKTLYVVHPFDNQRRAIERIINFWTRGGGRFFNRYRKEALKLVKLSSSLDEVILDIERKERVKPIIIFTSAKSSKEEITFKKLREILKKHPILILFGTGWGMVREKIPFDYQLEPIKGYPKGNKYNHLSVRSACAIILDRLFNR